MKYPKALIALYLVSAFSANCRGLATGSAETASTQSDTGSQAGVREQPCPVVGSVLSATTGAPLNKTSVRLLRVEVGSGSAIEGTYGATTDPSGPFHALAAAGPYPMSVAPNGYAQQAAWHVGSGK